MFKGWVQNGVKKWRFYLGMSGLGILLVLAIGLGMAWTRPPEWKSEFEDYFEHRLREVRFPATIKEAKVYPVEGNDEFKFVVKVRLKANIYLPLPGDPVFESRLAEVMAAYESLSATGKVRLEPPSFPEVTCYRQTGVEGQDLIVKGIGNLRLVYGKPCFMINEVMQRGQIDGYPIPGAKPWVLDGTPEAIEFFKKRRVMIDDFEKRIIEVKLELRALEVKTRSGATR